MSIAYHIWLLASYKPIHPIPNPLFYCFIFSGLVFYCFVVLLLLGTIQKKQKGHTIVLLLLHFSNFQGRKDEWQRKNNEPWKHRYLCCAFSLLFMASLLKKQINIFECILKRERERGSWLRGSFSFVFTRQTIFFKNSLASSNMPTKFFVQFQYPSFWAVHFFIESPPIPNLSGSIFSIFYTLLPERPIYLNCPPQNRKPNSQKTKMKKVVITCCFNEIYTLVWNHPPPSLPIFYQGLKKKKKKKN